MQEGRVNLNRYIPHVVVATFMVAVLPMLVVSTLSLNGLMASMWVSALAGAAISIGMGLLGSAAWKRYRRSQDLVFGDLLIWGWLRRRRVEARLAQVTRRLRLAPSVLDPDERLQVLEELASTLEADDAYTHGHSRRVTRHAYMVAKVMSLSEEMQAKVRTAAELHDVGKLYTPKDILHKPDRLTDQEFEVIKEHPGKGSEMVARLGDPEITEMVRHHHERLDGKGYPDALRGDDIPLGAKIIAVADTFDAITSARPYRSPRTHRVAIEILKKEAGSQLDENVVNAFLAYYSGRRSLAWWASLTTAPQRLLGSAAGWVQGAAVTAAKTAAAATAVSVMINPIIASPAVGSTSPSSREKASTRSAESAPLPTVVTGDGAGPAAPGSGETPTEAADVPGSSDARGENPAVSPSPTRSTIVPLPSPSPTAGTSNSGSGSSGSGSGSSGSGSDNSGSGSDSSGSGSSGSGSGSSGSGSSGSGSSGSGSGSSGSG